MAHSATSPAGNRLTERELVEAVRSDVEEYGTPVVLDLFCGVGGVARGFNSYGHRGPGWATLGIDADPEKAEKYPGYFVAADLSDGLPAAVEALADTIQIAWASPPCQFATGMQFQQSGRNLIPLARELLADVQRMTPYPTPTVIENVPGAREHLEGAVQMCGGALGLGVQKHRVFETNFMAFGRACDHPDDGFEYALGERESPKAGYRRAHGFGRDLGWTTKELREAIPPAYVHDLIGQYQKYAPQSITEPAPADTDTDTDTDDDRATVEV